MGDAQQDSAKIEQQQAYQLCHTPTMHNITAIADTGASGHYLRTNDPYKTDGTTRSPILVGLPNGANLQSTNQTCNLDLPQLPQAARDAHILPGLTHSSLISIGKLCDAGCTAIFDEHKIIIQKETNTILKGTRDLRTGLWRFPLANGPTTQKSTTKLQQLNSAYDFTSIPALIKFLHAAAFSPVKSTWLKAIKNGFFQSWPGLTSQAVTKHFPQSEATTKGHMDQTRKNVRTTQTRANQPKVQREQEDEPKQEPNNASTQQLFAAITETGKIYTDQTGRFPVTSSRGNKYILVLYNYDTNAILTEPLKNRTGNEILRAYQKLHTYLTNRGFKPRTHWLDNEASDALKQFNNQEQVSFQLVPPHMHRHNAAKRAIRTWKNHFVAGLCSTNTKFPMHLWDRLLPQVTITLNLLRPSRRNPQILAYQMLEGNYDFNSTPWHHQAPKSYYTRSRTNEEHGTHTERTVDIWDQH
jgi:hypothetical protein